VTERPIKLLVMSMSAMKKPRPRKRRARAGKARKAKARAAKQQAAKPKPRSPVAPPSRQFVDRKKEADRRRCRERPEAVDE